MILSTRGSQFLHYLLKLELTHSTNPWQFLPLLFVLLLVRNVVVFLYLLLIILAVAIVIDGKLKQYIEVWG